MGRRVQVGVWAPPGGPRRPSPVRPEGSEAAMAETAPQHLALPSGLLELCALLGPPRDSLRGLEQVRTLREDQGGRRSESGVTTRCTPSQCPEDASRQGTSARYPRRPPGRGPSKSAAECGVSPRSSHAWPPSACRVPRTVGVLPRGGCLWGLPHPPHPMGWGPAGRRQGERWHPSAPPSSGRGLASRAAVLNAVLRTPTWARARWARQPRPRARVLTCYPVVS